MGKGVIKFKGTNKLYRFRDHVETVNRTRADGTPESIPVEEAIKDREFIARLINKNSPLIEEIEDLSPAADKTQIAALNEKVAELEEENETLTSEIGAWRTTVEARDATIAGLTAELEKLKAPVLEPATPAIDDTKTPAS